MLIKFRHASAWLSVVTNDLAFKNASLAPFTSPILVRKKNLMNLYFDNRNGIS